LEVHAFAAFLEHISVVTEKEEVSLVVQRDDSPAFELRALREERGEESADPPADLRVEVLEDELGEVVGYVGMVRDLLVQDAVAYFENGSRSIRQVNQRQLVHPPPRLSPYHDVGVAFGRRELADLLEREVHSRVVEAVREGSFDLLQELEELALRADCGRQQDLGRLLLVEVRLKLVDGLLIDQLGVLLEDELLVHLALVVSGQRLLWQLVLVEVVLLPFAPLFCPQLLDLVLSFLHDLHALLLARNRAGLHVEV